VFKTITIWGGLEVARLLHPYPMVLESKLVKSNPFFWPLCFKLLVANQMLSVLIVIE